MTPDRLLAEARALVHRRDGAASRVWPRAAAFPARQALEGSLAAFWSAHPTMAAVGSTTTRTQLVCLRTAIDPQVAHRAAYTWAALSEACHYHPYELFPTAGELTTWFAAVDDIAAALTAELAAA